VTWHFFEFSVLVVDAGTIAGTIDDSFQTNSQLEIYSSDLGGASGLDMPFVGSLVTKDCFHKLAWGAKGMDDGSLPLGLLAGGMSDGSINLWNPHALFMFVFLFSFLCVECIFGFFECSIFPGKRIRWSHASSRITAMYLLWNSIRSSRI
jgi:hypothetical protein